MLNRAELLHKLDSSYTRFIGEIEKLSGDQLMVVGVTKLWSVRGLLAHVVWWQTRLARLVRGQPVEWNPRPDESKEAYLARLNAGAVAEMKHLDGRRALEMFRSSHAKMAELAGNMTEGQLANEELMQAFANDTYGHYDEHVASVQRFAARQIEGARG